MNALELQAHVPLLYVACLWGGAIAGLRVARPRLTLRARHTSRLSAGQKCPVEFSTETSRAFACRVLPLALPAGLDCSPPDGAALAPDSTATLWLHARRRGIYALRGWRAASDFPLGVLRAWRDYLQPGRLVVVPAFTPLTHLELGRGRTGAANAHAPRRKGEADEFCGNRPFREGDPVRHINWRATARMQDLMVREWHAQPLLRAGIILDTRATNAQDALFERAVSLCAAIADYCARTGYTVDLFAAGTTVHHLQTGPQQPFLDEILDLLAGVQREQPDIVPGHESFLTLLSPQLAGADALLFISVDADRAKQELAQDASALQCFVVCDEPTTQPTQPTRDFIFVSRAAQEAGTL